MILGVNMGVLCGEWGWVFGDNTFKDRGDFKILAPDLRDWGDFLKVKVISKIVVKFYLSRWHFFD